MRVSYGQCGLEKHGNTKRLQQKFLTCGARLFHLMCNINIVLKGSNVTTFPMATDADLAPRE